MSQRDWDDAHLIDVLFELHEDDDTLGYRFLTDELADEHGIIVGENRVHRLCQIAGITASHHTKKGKTGKAGPAPHDDLLAVTDRHGVLRHEFTATRPNAVWLWDISEHPTTWIPAVVATRAPTILLVKQPSVRRGCPRRAIS
ncbi:IS3 family transposase, partial [Leucobacter luti]|uniref:IS3 family transposase n=1 Tax=Leucobacter luti TaxID=340320 RepID=UPI00141529A2